MSTDLKLALQGDGQTYDLVIGDNGDFEGEEGLDTTLIVSVLSDARASASEVAIPAQRGGWLGNLVFPRENSQLGSLLWLIEQRRRTTGNLNIAVDQVQKALQWLVDDGIAKEVTVSGELAALGGAISISAISSSGITENLYLPLWKETGND